MIDLSDRKQCFYWQTDRNLSAQEYKRIFLGRQEISDETISLTLRDGTENIRITSLSIQKPDENVTKGNVNVVRKIDINGATYVVRMHPAGVKNGYFYVEREALKQARLHGIPVPEVVEVHSAVNEKDMDYMILTASPGVTMDNYLKKNPSAEDPLVYDCGVQMAAIHTIPVTGFGSFDNSKAKEHNKLVGLHDSYESFMHTGLAENLSRLVTYDVISQAYADAMNTFFQSHKSYEPSVPKLIHNDLADWNVLTDGTRLTAVLDWDECHAGDPIADIACWSTFFTIERMKSFLQGYTSVSPLPSDYQERFHFYRLRYTISKMALRIKRFQVDQAPFIIDKLKVGKVALSDEMKWFHLI